MGRTLDIVHKSEPGDCILVSCTPLVTYVARMMRDVLGERHASQVKLFVYKSRSDALLIRGYAGHILVDHSVWDALDNDELFYLQDLIERHNAERFAKRNA